MDVKETTVVIVGDGPTGLSAGLLLAKTGFEAHVIGANKSGVHKAMLYNYLGDDNMPGPQFLEASREHAERYGAKLHEANVERVEVAEPFRVVTDDGTFEGDYLVLATGFDKGLLDALGLEMSEDGVRVDHNGRTSRDRVYAGGAVTRGMKSQAASSVGDGAAIAVDILSRVRGKPSHDYDVLKQKAETRPSA